MCEKKVEEGFPHEEDEGTKFTKNCASFVCEVYHPSLLSFAKKESPQRFEKNAWGSYKEKNGQSLESFAWPIKAIAKYEHFDCIDLYSKKGRRMKSLVNYKRLRDLETGRYKNYPYPEFIGIPLIPQQMNILILWAR